MQISNVEELKAWIAAGGVPDYLYFWGHTPAQPQVPDKSCFSQWFPSPFSLAGVTYATAEHYMMAQKAALFGDTAVQARIVAAERPSEVKKLGREVANFDAKAWEAARAVIRLRDCSTPQRIVCGPALPPEKLRKHFCPRPAP